MGWPPCRRWQSGSPTMSWTSSPLQACTQGLFNIQKTCFFAYARVWLEGHVQFGLVSGGSHPVL
jgi:hypothetical protein